MYHGKHLYNVVLVCEFSYWFEISRTFADDFLENIVIPTFGPRWQISFGWKTRTDLSVKIISFPSPMNKFEVHSIFSLRILFKEYINDSPSFFNSQIALLIKGKGEETWWLQLILCNTVSFMNDENLLILCVHA